MPPTKLESETAKTDEMVAAGEEVRTRQSRHKDLIIKYASLIILVVQNASYVLLLRYVRTRKMPMFLSTVAVFQTEVVKLVTCLIIFTMEQKSLQRAAKALYHHLIVNWLDTLKVGVPAFVYVVQNVLLYYAVSNLDAATYMVTYQLKILTTAIFTVTILRRKISFLQWVALVLLFTGVAIVQLNKDEKSPVALNQTEALMKTTVATVTETAERVQHPFFGLVAVIVACFLSGFAGIYFEKILKGSDVSLWMRNIQLALLSLPCGLGAIMVKDGGKVLEYGMMQGFDIVVWGTVVLGAVGGLVVAVVMKYADNILKAFATSIAIIVSCVASAFLFSFSPTLMFLAGTGLVIAAVFVYSLFPYRAKTYEATPKEIKEDEREKTRGPLLNDEAVVVNTVTLNYDAMDKVIVRADPLSNKPVELWKKYLRQGRICEPAKTLRLDAPIYENKVRFVCISDTHEKLGEILDLVPDGDVLIHAGDFTNYGDVGEVIKFNAEIGKLPHKYKIVIAGNHELGFEDGEDMNERQLAGLNMLGIKKAYEMLTNCIYLCDQTVDVFGIKVYGTPWHPMPGYSFYRPRGQALLHKWNLIPPKTDVLVTHTPPLGHGDFNSWQKCDGLLAGCAELLNTVEMRVKPKYHVFGHIHQMRGATTNGTTTFINASICDHKLRSEYDPIIFDLPLPPGRSKDEF